ncbi:YdcF family protein [Bacillus sp. CGMCC 1.16607]|uniref:YdcF family protein n=1 Tax=Bacillus sp. CGMCC 1.16607 TaxID=3351842 RepID=UPI00363009D6
MGKPIIPKEPIVPELKPEQISELTNIVFGHNIKPEPCDAIFVFSGTHPGHWEKTIEAYKKGLSKKIIVTGGVSPTGVSHPEWKDKNVPESIIIIAKLIESGIKEEDIISENRSRNTLENVLYAKEVFNFNEINSLLFVCKNHAGGRQYRTLAKHISNEIRYIQYGFDSIYQGVPITRENWMNTEAGRSRVFGEFLRIIFYGRRGDILPVEKEIDGLEEYVI